MIHKPMHDFLEFFYRTRRIYYSIFVALVWVASHGQTSIASTPNSVNSLVKWTDPTPSALQPFDGPEALAELTGSTLFFYPQAKSTSSLPYTSGPKTYQNVQYVTGAMVVPASVDQVEKLLSNYAAYTKLFPKITDADVLVNEQSGNLKTDSNARIRSIVKYHMHIKIPIPLLSFNEDLIMQHERTHNSISTLIISSPIQYGSGKFEWFPLKNGKTLVTLTQWGDLDRPKGFLVKTILAAMPELKYAIPNGVQGFVMESLRQRLNPDVVTKATPIQSIVPNFDLNNTQEVQILKLLRQGGTVQFSHQPVWAIAGGHTEKFLFVSSFYNMPVSSDKAKAGLINLSNFPSIYSQVRKVTTKKLNNGSTDNDLKIGIGLGVISIPMHVKLFYIHEPEQNSYRFSSSGGDVEFVQGRIIFKELSPKNTLIHLIAAGKLGENPPLLLKLAKNLPYPDYLPSVGSATVIFEKTKTWLQK
ncbi:MAG: SRPBCC family protein [Candidatus Saccharibacteria bacterium]|nr:SRPBCC family protein [Moraxellaceae bacterium]